ncbi:MAG: hypothetical protein AB2L09_03895 [Coriobacteriia bacterium]
MGHRGMPDWERMKDKTLAAGGGAVLFALPMVLASAGVAFMVGLATGKMIGKRTCMPYGMHGMHGMRSPWDYKMMGGMGMGAHHHHGYGQPPCTEMHEGKYMGKHKGEHMGERQTGEEEGQESPMGM